MDKVVEEVLKNELLKRDKDFLVDYCLQKQYEYELEFSFWKQQIESLQNQLALTEKALELACLYIFENEFDESADKESCIKDMIDVFKTKAKEMMKSE